MASYATDVRAARAEAEYAFNTQKRIVALRLEPDYNPDRWLGPLCRNNLYYDFSSPEKFDAEWSRLHAKLDELSRPGCYKIHGGRSTLGQLSLASLRGRLIEYRLRLG